VTLPCTLLDFFGSSNRRNSQDDHTDFDAKYVKRRDSTQRCAFWGFPEICAHLGGQISRSPIFWREYTFLSQTHEILKLSYYQNCCIDRNKILHKDKEHQVLFVSGPDMSQTNPRWRMAAILKVEKKHDISKTV